MIFASEGLLFGTAGVPKSARAHSTLAGIQHIASMGLDCLEIEFVKGVRMGSDLAKKIGQEASRLNVRLSVHAPYSINLNAPEEGKRLASQERILHSAREKIPVRKTGGHPSSLQRNRWDPSMCRFFAYPCV